MNKKPSKKKIASEKKVRAKAMSRLFQSVDFNSMSSCSSESENDSSSEDDETEDRMSSKSSQTKSDDGMGAIKKSMKSQNILLKLNNREVMSLCKLHCAHILQNRFKDDNFGIQSQIHAISFYLAFAANGIFQR